MHGGVNQRLLVPELYDVIVPARCRCRVKKDRVVLLLKTGPPVVPFSAWQKLSSGAADPVVFPSVGTTSSNASHHGCAHFGLPY